MTTDHRRYALRDVANMPWKPLPTPGELPPEFKRRTRFLVDEALGQEVANYLEEKGYNAMFVDKAGLTGHSDEDVFAYAWRERRVLLTHDHDFLDDTRFPEHRNPGVIVLPGGGGDRYALGFAIGVVMTVFGMAPSIWEKSKITVNGDYITIRNRDEDGKTRTTRYREIRRRYEMFEDD